MVVDLWPSPCPCLYLLQLVVELDRRLSLPPARHVPHGPDPVPHARVRLRVDHPRYGEKSTLRKSWNMTVSGYWINSSFSAPVHTKHYVFINFSLARFSVVLWVDFKILGERKGNFLREIFRRHKKCIVHQNGWLSNKDGATHLPWA